MHLARYLLLVGTALAGHISLDLHQNIVVPVAASARSRRETLGLDTLVEKAGHGLYFVSLQIGTPPQTVELALDTGSSDLLVNSAHPTGRSSSETKRDIGIKAFDPKNSETYEVASNESSKSVFESEFIDGTEAFGEWFKDTISVGGKKIPVQQIGLNKASNQYPSILGLGFKGAETAVDKYPTLLENMVSEKIIDRQAFSLYLTGDDDASGNILFGGIDTHKFTGELKPIHLVNFPVFFNTSDDVHMWNVPLTDIAVSNDKGDLRHVTEAQGWPNSIMTRAAFLDSGSTLSILPGNLVEDIGKDFEVVLYSVNKTMDVALIPCKYGTTDAAKDGSVSFEFGSDVVINVPVHQLVYDIGKEAIEAVTGTLSNLDDLPFELDQTCLFGLQAMPFTGVPLPNIVAVLGHNVLRSAYIVFDADNLVVGIAQANQKSSETNIVELKAGQKELPRLKGTNNGDSTDSQSDEGGKSGGGDNANDSAAEDAAGVLEDNYILLTSMIIGTLISFLM